MGTVLEPYFVAFEKLLSAVASINPAIILPLHSSNVTYSNLQPMLLPVAGGANTSVVLTAVAGSGYSGTATLYYQRQDLGASFSAAGIAPLIVNSRITSWSQFNAAMNARYNTLLTDIDSPSTALPDFNTASPLTLTYTVSPASLLYVGALAVAVRVPTLTEGFTTAILAGLTPPPPTLSSQVTTVAISGLTITQLQ